MTGATKLVSVRDAVSDIGESLSAQPSALGELVGPVPLAVALLYTDSTDVLWHSSGAPAWGLSGLISQ